MKIHVRKYIGIDRRTLGLDLEFEPEDLILEISCEDKNCKAGYYKSGAKCQSCDGHRIVPTPLGMHILSFVCRHAKDYRSGVYAQIMDREAVQNREIQAKMLAEIKAKNAQ